MRRLTEVTLLWLFPILSLLYCHHHWTQHPAALPAGWRWFLLLLPALMMYLVVGTGAGYAKLWQFNVPYAVAGVHPLIGFMYSGVVNLLLVLWPLLENHHYGLFGGLLAASCGLAGTLYDVPLVHYRLLWMSGRQKLEVVGLLRKVLSYGPLFFSLVGGMSAAAVLLNYPAGLPTPAALGLRLVGTAVLGALPFQLFLVWAHRRRQAVRTRQHGQPAQ